MLWQWKKWGASYLENSRLGKKRKLNEWIFDSDVIKVSYPDETKTLSGICLNAILTKILFLTINNMRIF